MAKVGTLIIGTGVDTSGFERQYAKLERDIEKKQTAIEIETKGLNKSVKYAKELEKQLDKIDEEFDQISAEAERFAELENKALYGTLSQKEGAEWLELSMRDITAEEQKYLAERKKIEDSIDRENEKIEKQKQKIEDLTFQHSDLVAKTEEFKNKINSVNFDGIKKEIDKIGNGLEKTIKQVGRWALAVFGIRSAYLFVRQAMSTLSSYNEQLATDLQYIRFAVASVLQPVIERIVQLAYQLLQIIGTIVQLITGKNIFKNAGVDKFSKNLGTAASNAKELNKQLAGFDEINKVSNTTTSSSTSGGTIPSIDLSTINTDTSFLKFLEEHLPKIVGLLEGVAAALVLIRLGFDPIKALGIGIMIYGIINFISDLIDYINKLDGSLKDNGTTFEDFGKIVTDIGLIVLGLGLVIGNLPLIISGVALTIIGLLIKNWNKIKKGINNVLQWFENKINEFERKGIIGKLIAGFMLELKIGIAEFGYAFDGLFSGIKQFVDGVLLLFKGDFKNGLIQIVKGTVNTLIGFINVLISGFNTLISPLRSIANSFGNLIGIKGLGSTVRLSLIPKLAKGTILNNPGKGIPVAGYSAIAGEAGREAYLPLSDTRLLEELGQTLGKYVRIDNVIDVNMDSRRINRILQQSQNRVNFMTNR